MKHIYLIQSQEDGYYKIGVSKHPKKRVKQLQTGNSSELKLLNVDLKVPGVKYMTFAHVKEELKGKAHIGKDDLTGEAEKALGELYPDTIVFVHDWPLAGKPFYIMPLCLQLYTKPAK